MLGTHSGWLWPARSVFVLHRMTQANTAQLAMSFAICFAGCGVFGRYSSHHNGSDRAVAGTPSPNEKGYERRRL